MRLTHTKFAAITAAALFAAVPLALAADQPSSSSNHQGQHQSDQQGQSSSSSQANGSQSKQQSNNQAPEGWVLIEDDVLAVTINEPQNHFVQAERDLANKDPKAASQELLIVSQYMKMQASRDQGQEKQRLLDAAGEVRNAADQLAQSSGNESNQLKQTISKADLALAQHFQAKAESELQDKREVMAGHDLQAATSSLEGAVAQSNQQLPSETTSAIAKARTLAVQLIGPETSANATGANAGEAQQASAKQGTNQQANGNSVSSANSNTNSAMPQDASKTVQTLGDAIQKCCSTNNDAHASAAGNNK